MPFVITRFRYNQFRCKEKKLHERRLETNRTLCLLRYNEKFVKNKFVINKFDCIARISDESIYTNQLRSVVRNINNKINNSNKDLSEK
jgi:hypothetical protein